MHIGSPAGQILNLSVNQMEEQLWLCICKFSGELLASTECRALLKTHSPLQTATKTSPFSKVSCGTGKCSSFGVGWNRAGDKVLLCKYRMWQWNEDLQGKRTEEWVSRRTGSSGGSNFMETALDWPWQSCVFYRSDLFPWKQTGTNRNSHCSERLSQQNTKRMQQWEKINSFISVQHPSVLQDKPLAAGETLHP